MYNNHHRVVNTRTHTHPSNIVAMENGTAIPVVSGCRSMTYEHDQLWIAPMVMVSSISTLTALILRKRQACSSDIVRAPLCLKLGEVKEEEKNWKF